MNRKIEYNQGILSLKQGVSMLSRPDPLGLVLSGGGAKGIAYAGLIRTLEYKNKLNNLHAIAGSSAGALTASLIAFGLNSKDIEFIVSNTNFDRLRYNQSILNPASGQRLRNYLELIFLTQLSKLKKKFEFSYPPELELKMTAIKKYLEIMHLNFQNFVDIVNLSDEQLEALDSMYLSMELLPSTTRLTFADIQSILPLINEFEQNMIKGLYVAVHNNTNKQLMKCCYENTPDLPISPAVQTSAALPPLYQASVIDGFECNDGGIIDNMPAKLLMEHIDPERLL
jgi:VPS inhibitor protein D